MKFSIITPSYRRYEKLVRAIDSLLHQTHNEWEMIIINDSPDDLSYLKIESNLQDSRIHYFVNTTNRGVNYSRNYAMDKVAVDSDWIIFLDDDDYLAPDALSEVYTLIKQHTKVNWFVTNRAYTNGILVTNYPKNNTYYSYIWDCLLLKRCRGDATHIIRTSTVRDVRYSTKIKQAEEWIFYYQISLNDRLFYHSHNTTLTDGYDQVDGLNFRKRSTHEQIQTLKHFISEGKQLDLLYRPTFILYLCMRLLRSILKNK